MIELIEYLLGTAAILFGLIGLRSLVKAIIRGRSIPKCLSCGEMKVRPSHRDGVLDSIASLFLIRPYRCGTCRKRFHALCLFSASRQSEVPRGEGKRALKVIFRLRHGLPNRVSIRLIHLAQGAGK